MPLIRQMDCGEPFDLLRSYENAKARGREGMLFSEGDWQECDRLFADLGKGDREAQVELLSLCEEKFGTRLQELRETCRRNGKPALVLGGSAGAVLVLMLM